MITHGKTSFSVGYSFKGDIEMEAQLMEAIKQAEKEYNKLYSGTYQRIYDDAGQYVESTEEIKNLMQVVYVEVYRCISSGDDYDNIDTLLEGILERQGKSIAEKQDVVSGGKSVKEATEEADLKTEEAELTVEQAQEIYNACCLAVGLPPTEILSDKSDDTSVTGKKGEKTVKEKVKEKAKKVVKDEIEGAVKDEVKKGVKKVVGEVVKSGTAEEAGQAIGLIAKLAALSTKMKVLIMAGTLAASAVTVGVVGTVVSDKQDEATDTFVSEEQGNELDSYDVSDCLGLYYYEYGSDYNAPSLVKPTKISENTYVFYAKDMEEYFSDGDYAVLVVQGTMPEELAVAYYSYGVAPGQYIPAWSDEKIMYVPITSSCDIIVTVSLKEDAAEIRQNIYY